MVSLRVHPPKRWNLFHRVRSAYTLQRLPVGVRFQLMRYIRAHIFPSCCEGCGYGREALCCDCLPALHDRELAWLEHDLPVVSMGTYADGLRTALIGYKSGRRDIGDCLVTACAQRVAAFLPDAAAYALAVGEAQLVGIPASGARRRERGFDNGEFLAEGLAAMWGVGMCRALRKTQNLSQRGLGRRDRLTQRARFAARTRLPRAAILVDDVLTTGATLQEARDVLSAAGFVVLAAIVLARTPLVLEELDAGAGKQELIAAPW